MLCEILQRRSRRLGVRALAFGLVLWASGTATGAAGIKVVASILPVHSLVSGVMAGVGEPELIVSGDADVHWFALKPSTRRVIENADAIFYIGPRFETYLDGAIAASPGTSVALTEAEELIGAPVDTTALKQDHFDPHVWLDPVYAAAMIRAIVRELVRLDPSNQEQYQQNGRRLEENIEKLRQEIDAQLDPIRAKKFIVYHNAYTHFQNRFGLGAVSHATNNETLTPGARRVKELLELATADGTGCFFVEPGETPPVVDSIARQANNVQVRTLDPVGRNHPPGEEQWFHTLRAIGTALVDCLAE